MGMVCLYCAATHRDAEVAGVWLHAIGGSTEETDESGYVATQEDSKVF